MIKICSKVKLIDPCYFFFGFLKKAIIIVCRHFFSLLLQQNKNTNYNYLNIVNIYIYTYRFEM